MTIIYQDAVSETVPNTDTTIYTCPTSAKSAHIQFANCTNSTASPATIEVNIVQSGDSVADTNVYIDAKTITANSSDGLSNLINCVLKPGDFVSCIAGTASAINLKLGIKEIY